MKPYYLLSSLLFLGLASCHDDVIENNHKTELLGRIQEQSTSEIINNYLSNTLSATRSNGNYTIEPITSDNDTIMYLANYGGEGWTLFSNDKRAKMVLMNSEEGSLSANDIKDENCPISNYILGLEESLLSLASDNSFSEIDTSWDLFSISQSSPISRDSTYGPFPGRQNLRVELVSPLTVIRDTFTIDHLCPTKWGQLEPWNNFIPLKNNTHCLAGCIPVATAQYMYFQHFRINVPQTAPTSAYYDATNNTYSFSDKDSTIWSSMALNLNEAYEKDTNYAAMLIGDVAKNIVSPSNFGKDKTTAKVSEMTTYLSSIELGIITMTYNTTAIDIIKSTINNGNILIARGSNSASINETGHVFLIDGLVQMTTRTSGIYDTYLETISNTGEVISSTKLKSELIEKSDTTTYTLMNWGFEGGYDDTWCPLIISEGWSPNEDVTYNHNQTIFFH